MLEQPFNPVSQNATEEQRIFWKKSAIVRGSTLALAIISLVVGVFTFLTIGLFGGGMLIITSNLTFFILGVIIMLIIAVYFVLSYFCFKAFGRLRRLGIPKKRMYIIIIICMVLSLIVRIISWNIPIIELVYIVLAILSVVNISSIEKENTY
ncbi:hypothetical protein ACP0AK_10100 [Listeria ivanovii]|uniref:Uncharacterized protein n=1 Tax=Listeria ivanovii (strain ATCC BAA-678 / PAM 55) TaxID=881621 RepID=G2Z9C1_LISIP|nr:hypothetical protein [Listeria ivanovii]AHI57342.1 hypothetical protein AX25_14545 [Listeria ivanovii WSLC3009]AIS66638.1 hypothetical protein JL52_14315 [Listeria ivanovii subsp. ivanovii]MBC1759691.1 hypothetical protein [Listeria ivanovii]MBK3914826.1 hypothetical protein [Listeria ivanovii subsp. ivanovii]MBK3922014.1 hypothetical protein [Listeria ivanovii subsp. ivanovii]